MTLDTQLADWVPSRQSEPEVDKMEGCLVKLCSYCGRENAVSSTSCFECGTTLPASATRPVKVVPSQVFHLKVWVQEAELGGTKVLKHQGREITYKVPRLVEGKVILRFKGFKQSKRNPAGELLVCLQLDRGDDMHRDLFLSEGEAQRGTTKTLLAKGKEMRLSVPAKSSEGKVIRVTGFGAKAVFRLDGPWFRRKRGDLCLRLKTYPDAVEPVYQAAESLSTEDLALEGWVYRRMDVILECLGNSIALLKPVPTSTIVDVFNDGGWSAVFHFLQGHFGLGWKRVTVSSSSAFERPGRCQTTIYSTNGRPTSCSYAIEINKGFINDPFAVTAILAHELCHVVHSQRLASLEEQAARKGGASLEEERTVDLLVFMYRLGEFQLRVARSAHKTLGYFNQKIFERIQVIASRKWGKTSDSRNSA